MQKQGYRKFNCSLLHSGIEVSGKKLQHTEPESVKEYLANAEVTESQKDKASRRPCKVLQIQLYSVRETKLPEDRVTPITSSVIYSAIYGSNDN